MIADTPLSPVENAEPPNDLASKVLDSLVAAVAVIDRRGKIVSTNQAWREFADENGGTREATDVGVNYLEVCRRVTGDDEYLAEQARQGIIDVLEGHQSTFQLEYPCHSPQMQRWFLLSVVSLKKDPHYVVTAHLSITKRKLIEAQLVATERLAAIGEAMQGLSHLGRNSLQRAQGSIDLLRCHIEHDRDAVALLDRIEVAQQRLISLYEEVPQLCSADSSALLSLCTTPTYRRGVG